MFLNTFFINKGNEIKSESFKEKTQKKAIAKKFYLVHA